MRACLGLLVALPWLGVAAPAVAAPPLVASAAASTRSLDSALRVEAGATCLDRATLLMDLRSWRDSEDIDARVTIEVHGADDRASALRFELRIAGKLAVERSFDPAPPSCDDLHAVVALALAIALDDTLAGELGIVVPVAPEPVEQVEAGEGDLPRFGPIVGPSPARTRSGPALALTPLALISVGLTPRVTGGGALSFDIRPRDHFDVRLAALAVHEQKSPLGTGSADLTLAAGRVDLCWGTAPLSVRLRLCGGIAAGAMFSRGRDFAENSTAVNPWVAGIAGTDIEVHLVGPLALELRLEGVIPFVRNRIDVQSETGEVLDSKLMPVAGFLVSLGPRFEF